MTHSDSDVSGFLNLCHIDGFLDVWFAAKGGRGNPVCPWVVGWLLTSGYGKAGTALQQRRYATEGSHCCFSRPGHESTQQTRAMCRGIMRLGTTIHGSVRLPSAGTTTPHGFGLLRMLIRAKRNEMITHGVSLSVTDGVKVMLMVLSCRIFAARATYPSIFPKSMQGDGGLRFSRILLLIMVPCLATGVAPLLDMTLRTR